MSLAWVLASVAQLGPTASSGSGGLTLMDAVKQALSTNPNIELQRATLLSSKGALNIADGQFDWNLQASLSQERSHLPLFGTTETASDTTIARLAMLKQFGWGMTVVPSVSLSRTESPNPFAIGTSTTSAGNVSIQITQPILRNFGIGTSLQKDAAQQFLKASGRDLQHVISERIFNTANAYWNYLFAAKSLEILQGAEARAEQVLKDAKALVAADERPKADLEQLEANLADRMRDRYDGEQSLYDAKNVLGLEMGIPAEQIAVLPLPTTQLPAFPAEFQIPANKFVEVALAKRQDLAGAKFRTEGSKILVGGAENHLLPQLDVTGELGFGGFTFGGGVGDYFGALGKNVPGPNGRIALTLQWPIVNSAAEGELQQAESSLLQNEVLRDDLSRRIGASVLASIEQLKTSIRTGERAKKSAVHYRSAVDNERTKLKSGLSTIIDVVLTEDRMTNALLSEVNTQTRYAQSLARVSFETGTLTSPENEESATIDMNRLVSAASP